jgi:hypothetical protein
MVVRTQMHQHKAGGHFSGGVARISDLARAGSDFLASPLALRASSQGELLVGSLSIAMGPANSGVWR